MFEVHWSPGRNIWPVGMVCSKLIWFGLDFFNLLLIWSLYDLWFYKHDSCIILTISLFKVKMMFILLFILPERLFLYIVFIVLRSLCKYYNFVIKQQNNSICLLSNCFPDKQDSLSATESVFQGLNNSWPWKGSRPESSQISARVSPDHIQIISCPELVQSISRVSPDYIIVQIISKNLSRLYPKWVQIITGKII